MRNLFDQYTQPENRLSHALATSLAEDDRLLRAFLRWASCELPGRKERLHVGEQQVPGEIEDGSDESRGLPDIAVHGDEGFCLLVESKIAASVSLRQLERHRRTAERAGFPGARVLVLATDTEGIAPTHDVIPRSWPALYTMMLDQRSRSEWARRLVEYMEVAEVDLAQRGYLREGTLTQFAGIHFDEETPYRYDQAKRLLRLMLDELRLRPDLRDLGISASGEGRPAITGTRGRSVWDFLRLEVTASGPFTKHPHVTLSLHPEHIGVMVTLPNGAARHYRRQLEDLGAAGMRELVGVLSVNIERATRGLDGARPVMYVVQRHFASQRSKGVEDAHLGFDLRTAVTTRRGKIRIQPEWIEAVHQVISSKQSNLQVGVGAEIPYDSDVVRSRRVLDRVAAVWVALEPWLSRGLGLPPRAGVSRRGSPARRPPALGAGRLSGGAP